MYKYLGLLTRKDGMSHEAFLEHWATEHTEIARKIEDAVRYNRVEPADPQHAEYDGIAEVFFEDLGDLHDAFGGPNQMPDTSKEHAQAAMQDAVKFLDIDALTELIGVEHVQKDEVDGETEGLYKHSAFLVRQDGMSHDEFVRYWQEEHTPIARDIEGVVRYTTVIPTAPETAPFDGVAELYFENLGDVHDALGSPGSRDYDPSKEVASRAREDVDNFLAIERRPRLIGQERVEKNEG